jgi:hypothetical protein
LGEGGTDSLRSPLTQPLPLAGERNMMQGRNALISRDLPV